MGKNTTTTVQVEAKIYAEQSKSNASQVAREID